LDAVVILSLFEQHPRDQNACPHGMM